MTWVVCGEAREGRELSRADQKGKSAEEESQHSVTLSLLFQAHSCPSDLGDQPFPDPAEQFLLGLRTGARAQRE